MATETSRRSTLYRLATPFWNATEGRPRALWRVLGAFVLAVAAAVLGHAWARNGSFGPPFATEYDPDR
jgi:hypothetical protein